MSPSSTINSHQASNTKTNEESAPQSLVNEGQTLELDEEGHLLDHNLWTPEVAQQLADTLEVTLTDDHYRIL